MTDSKYLDKNGKLIQEGDVRINSIGIRFLILKDNYRDMNIIDEDLDASECRTCELHDTILIEQLNGNAKERLIQFIYNYIDE